jgi:hypothetical protein
MSRGEPTNFQRIVYRPTGRVEVEHSQERMIGIQQRENLIIISRTDFAAQVAAGAADIRNGHSSRRPEVFRLFGKAHH